MLGLKLNPTAALTVATITSVMLAAAFTTRASAASVDPVFVAGNPTCVSLGYDFGFKVDPPDAGTYEITGLDGETVTVTTDGVEFDWTSTIGMDAVIAKGGPNANVYVYDPPAESFGDTDLHSPINPNNGQPFGLSHIEFCYDIELEVTKTAETSFIRTCEWDIDKSVSPATLDLFDGDSGTVEYTVTLDKTCTDSDWEVSGEITIHNPGPVAASITGVTDTISGGINATVECSGGIPQSLAAGATLVCTYSADLPNGNNRTNTATVTTTGLIGGGSGTADVTFGDPDEIILDEVTVDDDVQGPLGTFDDDGSTSYTRTFDCGDDEGSHKNTATINETQDSDDSTVTVNCYELEVTKDADLSFDRRWTWTIEKTADQTELLLSPGQSFVVNYSVTVDASFTDENYAVTGTISVYNPNPTLAALLNSVSDIVSPAILATVDCGVTFPHSLAAGGTLNCTYDADLPDGTQRTNTATATQQNHDYDEDGVGTPSGTSDYTGTADVPAAVEGDLAVEIDECIEVTDLFAGILGTVCASDTQPTTFNYARTIGPFSEPDDCGDHLVPNTAAFETNDTGTEGSDDHDVNVEVRCGPQGGCTLTPGYWKTHSDRGPAPYDDTWALLPGGLAEDTVFFLSGQTWYQVYWTAPAGNVYYNLAHHYMAAVLNQLNGAAVPADVQTAINSATTLFNTYTPAVIASKKGNQAPRPQFVSLAATLAAYNEGISGPGHCSEESE